MPTNSNAQTSEFTERDDTRISCASRLSGAKRHEVVRGENAHRQRQDEREQRAERRDVDRLDQRRVHVARIVAPVDRPHPRQQVDDLLRRVGQELRDHLDRAQRATIAATIEQVDREAREPLRRREAAPAANVGR